MNSLLSFFSPAELFNFRPIPMAGGSVLALAAVALALAAAGIGLTVAAGRSRGDGLNRRSLYRLASPLAVMGALLLGYAAIAYQGLPIFSAKLWLLLWAIVLLAWLAVGLRYRFATLPKIRADRRQQEEFRRYLPK